MDTHVLIWAASEPNRLSPNALATILNAGNRRLISLVTAWELNIKFSTEKITLSQLPNEFVEEQRRVLIADLLPIELHYLAPIADLPLHHRDPFDRLLIAQCLVEDIPIISADAAFDAYEHVNRIW